MRFLCDVGVSTSTLKALREAGYEAVHLREQNLHRLPDSAILQKAFEEGRILITFDLDFFHPFPFEKSYLLPYSLSGRGIRGDVVSLW